jgi:autotransporter passenger strand-loop-strand repeat protein
MAISTFLSGGLLAVTESGTATATTVASGGSVTVAKGGETISTYVSSRALRLGYLSSLAFEPI